MGPVIDSIEFRNLLQPFYNLPMPIPSLYSDPAPLPLLESLNEEQRAAVTLPPENALILAGAGSGKTRVLTTRIAWLLQNGYVSQGGVMAVTFTNKAAKEMMTRLSAMLPVNVRGMWIGTFHGLCNRFLRAHFKTANLPQAFQILDTQDQLSAVKRLCKQIGVDEERFPPKQLVWFIASCKEEGLRANAVEVRDSDTRRKVDIYQLYEEQCQREGVEDFGGPVFVPVLFDWLGGRAWLAPQVRAIPQWGGPNGAECANWSQQAWAASGVQVSLAVGLCQPLNPQSVQAKLEEQNITAPSALIHAAAYFDVATQKAWLFSGMEPDGTVASGLWQLAQVCGK